jgi:protein-L-isoaspartate(D-aspartate) O-methyltransferase
MATASPTAPSARTSKTGGFESGVFAHGPNAETVAERYVDLLRQWAREHRRRGAACIGYLPNPAETACLTGWHTAKRHDTVVVSWS